MTDSANQNQSTDDQGSGFAKKLDGRRIAVLAGQGVEQVELTDPMRAIRAAGGTPVIVSYSEGSFVAMKGDWEHADSFAVDVDVNEAEVEPFDALVLPGGVVNADHLRLDDDAVRFTRDFFAQHKPVGVICHGAWILTEAGVVEGRTSAEMGADLHLSARTVEWHLGRVYRRLHVANRRELREVVKEWLQR